VTARPRAAPAARTAATALRVAATVLLTLTVAGCGWRASTGDPGRASAGTELTVFAAASLREAFGAVKEAYEAATPAVTLVFSFDASSALRAQVEQGAPVDVFASADTRNPRILADAGLTSGEPLAFAGNRLAIVVPAANPARIASPADLARPGVRLVNAGPEVPITAYAGEMLSNLARLPGYPERYAAAVAANVVSREDNVKAVLAKIQLGEGDAGVVYATDVTAAGDDVRTIPIPDEANVVATYAAVVPKDAPHPAAAASFLAWLSGPDGMAVLARFGFTAPTS
jgi:molybdate transport system substrate-binding protein